MQSRCFSDNAEFLRSLLIAIVSLAETLDQF